VLIVMAAEGHSSPVVTRLLPLLLLLQAQGSDKDAALDVSGLQDQFSGGQRACMQLQRSSGEFWRAQKRPATQSCANSAKGVHPPSLQCPCLPAQSPALAAAMRASSLGRFASSGPTHLEFPLF
jgi:hypothetical protein